MNHITLNSIPNINSKAFSNIGRNCACVITLPWSSGEVEGAPWGATSNATLEYLGILHPGDMIVKPVKPPTENLLVHLPLTADFSEAVSNRTVTVLNSLPMTSAFYKDHQCMDFNKKNAGLQIKAADLQDINERLANHAITMSIWTNPQYTNTNWSTYVRFGPKKAAECLQLAATYNGQMIAGSNGYDIGMDASISGNWFHSVITYNEETHTIEHWENGTLVNTGVLDINLNLTSTEGLIIDQINNDCHHRYVQDFRIYDCVLTEGNIQWLYQNYKPKDHPQADELVYYAAEQIEPYDEFTIDEHTFENGVGIIQTYADVTSVGQIFRETPITGVEFPEGMVEIRSNAFNGCSGLVLEELPPNLMDIGGSAFEGCSAICIDTLPATLSSIGDYAFKDCVGITELTFLSTPTTLGESTFEGCDNLLAITVPWYEGSIPGAPWGAENAVITYAEYQEPIEPVEGKPASNQVFYWAPEQQTLATSGNVVSHIFDDGKGVITFSEPKTIMHDNLRGTSVTKVEMPDSIESIHFDAFRDCSSLSSVIMSDNISVIYNRAFYNCASFNVDALPSSLLHIWDNAFYNCSSLSLSALPSNVSAIYPYAFANCTSLALTDLPDVPQLVFGNSAFSGCSGMPLSSIPSGIVPGMNMFNECSSIRSITFKEGVTAGQIGTQLFIGCNNLTDIYVPCLESELYPALAASKFGVANATIHYDELQSNQIAYLASNQATLYNSNNVVSHESKASNWSGIPTKGVITYSSNLSSMPDTLKNSDIVQVILPSSVVEIKYSAFMNNTSIHYVTMPCVSAINNNAFRNCSSLTMQSYMYPETLPSTVVRIGERAFENCSELTLSALPLNLESVKTNAFDRCSNVTFRSIPESVSAIEDNAFYCCSSLTIDRIPSGVMSVGSLAFGSCFKLSSMTIENPLTRVYSSSFSNCSGISDIYVPWIEDAVPNAPWGAYNATVHYQPTKSYSQGLNDIIYYSVVDLTPTGNADVISGEFDDFIGRITLNPTATEFKTGIFDGKRVGYVSLPDFITSIGSGAFYYSSIGKVHIPSSVNEIGADAFSESNINLIEYPENVKTIRSESFRSTVYLQHGEFPGVSAIQSNAFNNSSISAINAPEVISIAEHAFYHSNIKEASFPKCEIVYSQAFQEAFQLSSVYLPECVEIQSGAFWAAYPPSIISAYIPKAKTIGDYAFVEHYYLESLDMSSVETIGKYAFAGVHELKDLTLPSTLVSIDQGAFTAFGASAIVFEGTPSSIHAQAFNSCNNLTDIYVPWASGAVANAPWGATIATIHYAGQVEPIEPDEPEEPDADMPDDSKLIFSMPFTSATQLHEMVSDTNMTKYGNGTITYTTVASHDCAVIPYSSDKSTSFQVKYNGFNTTDPTADDYVDVSGSFTLAGWVYITNAATGTWYTFMSLGDYSGDADSVKPKNNGGNLKVLNLMTKYSGKLGGGSEDTNIGIDCSDATGTLATSNTFSTNHWYLMVLTYDKPTGNLSVYMNRTVDNAESMQLIGSLPNKTLSIDPTTDLWVFLGFIKNKRQFKQGNVHGIKIWKDALTPANIQWLYEHPSY